MLSRLTNGFSTSSYSDMNIYCFCSNFKFVLINVNKQNRFSSVLKEDGTAAKAGQGQDHLVRMAALLRSAQDSERQLDKTKTELALWKAAAKVAEHEKNGTSSVVECKHLCISPSRIKFYFCFPISILNFVFRSFKVPFTSETKISFIHDNSEKLFNKL